MASAEHDPAASLLSLSREQSRWLSGLARQARLSLAIAIAAPLLSGGLLLLQAWLLAGVLDKAIVQGVAQEDLLLDIVWIALLIGVRTLFTWQGERAGNRASEKIKYLVRQALFTEVLGRGSQWTRQQVSGSVASVLIEQVEALDGFFAQYLPAMIAATFLPIAFAIVIIPVDWVAGLLLFVTAPLIPVFMALVGWGAEAASRRHLEAFARLSGFFADRIRGLSTFKLYGQADIEAERVYQASEAVRSRTMSVLKIAFLSSAVLEFFAALGVAGTALYIGLTYLGFVNLRGEDILTLQMGMFCLLMAPEVYNPLRQFAAHYHDRAAARAAVAQMSELYDALPEVGLVVGPELGSKVRPELGPELGSEVGPELGSGVGGSLAVVESSVAVKGGVPAPDKAVWVTAAESDLVTAERLSAQSRSTSQGFAVRLENVTLRVPGREQAVLKGLNAEIKPGETVALMGPSGIGKTSLLEAIAGLRQVEGEILINGQAFARWSPTELREKVSLIGQHAYIQTGTIADNLRLVAPDTDEASLQRAATLACLDEFISDLPDGLATHLGVRGYGLSGGQLQRVALARLFLRNPRLILLDEPTAHLDADTRDQVLDSLFSFAKGRSLLIVTHDPVVAQRVDRIWTIGLDLNIFEDERIGEQLAEDRIEHKAEHKPEHKAEYDPELRHERGEGE